ncbi:hypothetical protein F5882DRAFT_383933 [Hyaloscypha sp. PMI_1271]|nr:hypothetical protein F5882DRAFT_383933 [Hyaloscypha sp. PMI_1271]
MRVLSYEWTGESLKPLPQLAKDPEIQAKLKTDVPFTRQPSEREKPPIRAPRGGPDSTTLVKSRLCCEEDIPISEVDYIRAHPEDVEWLKANVRPRFLRKFSTQVNNNKPPGAPDIEE